MRKIFYLIFGLINLGMIKLSNVSVLPCAFNRYETESMACTIATHLSFWFGIVGVFTAVLLLFVLTNKDIVKYKVARMVLLTSILVQFAYLIRIFI
jgi:hypothetical protein